MHARTESPQLKRRLAFNRGRLAPPPAMDYRPAKPTTECVNQFQRFFLSELILHYKSETLDFKREQYPFSGAPDERKSELLKDILAMANVQKDSDRYILIGVEED